MIEKEREGSVDGETKFLHKMVTEKYYTKMYELSKNMTNIVLVS